MDTSVDKLDSKSKDPSFFSRHLLLVLAVIALIVAGALALLGVGDRSGALPNWQALILGLTQGLTELLPISSSGHLILVPWLGGWHYLENHEAFNKTFDVALHAGTLVAVLHISGPKSSPFCAPGSEVFGAAVSRPRTSGLPGCFWSRPYRRRSAGQSERT